MNKNFRKIDHVTRESRSYVNKTTTLLTNLQKQQVMGNNSLLKYDDNSLSSSNINLLRSETIKVTSENLASVLPDINSRKNSISPSNLKVDGEEIRNILDLKNRLTMLKE